jgi:hypothetical protein
MANAASMLAAMPVRLLLLGYPGAGKTGSLASLVNAGFKLRIIDFDGNPESLLQYSKPEMLKNVDIISFEDPLVDNQSFVGVKGAPKAFANSFKVLSSWKYSDADGTEVDLGPSSEWGTDTIVVLDGLTGQGKAAFRRAQFLTNKTPANTTQATWGLAIQDQENFIERLTSTTNKHHVIVISHLKMVGPKQIAQNENETNKELKEREADIIPTRLWPSALGWGLPQNIAGHFPVTVLVGTQTKGTAVKRTFSVQPRTDMDLKFPGVKIPADLSVENGMVELFKALGALPPK